MHEIVRDTHVHRGDCVVLQVSQYIQNMHELVVIVRGDYVCFTIFFLKIPQDA